jgi:hypothetical protein
MEDTCVVAVTLPYHFQVGVPKGTSFRGIFECEAAFKVKELAAATEKFHDLASGLLDKPGEMAILFSGERNDRHPSESFFALRHDPSGFGVDLVPGFLWSNLPQVEQELNEMLAILCPAARTQQVNEAIQVIPPAGTSFNMISSNLKKQFGHFGLKQPGLGATELFGRLSAVMQLPRFVINKCEVLLSFPFEPSRSDAAALRQVDLLNQLRLPIKSAKCELYYSIKSIKDLAGLEELRKMDKAGSAIEQCVAHFMTPGGLGGLVYVGATKKGFVVELHPGDGVNDEDFVKEMRTLLKAHLK